MATELNNLPDDVKKHIISFLDKRNDIAVLERVSKKWGKLADEAWKNKIKYELTGNLNNLNYHENINTYKYLYKSLYDIFLREMEQLLAKEEINKCIRFDLLTLENICKHIGYGYYDEFGSGIEYYESKKKLRDTEEFYECYFTPLSLTIVAGLEKLTSFLLECGANPNKPNEYIFNNPSDLERGYFIRDPMTSPIHEATLFEQLDCIKLLIKYGAKIDELSFFGAPLHIAVGLNNNSFEVTKLLLESGAMVDVKYYRGFTPLHIAATYKNKRVINLLLNFGANDLPNDNGDKPSDIALSMGYKLTDAEEDVNDSLDLENILACL